MSKVETMWIEAIETTPTKHDLKQAVIEVLSADLLSKKQRARVKPGAHKTAGHCAIASEALMHLLRIFHPDFKVKPMCATYREVGPFKLGKGKIEAWTKGEHDESERETHWWLATDEELIDLTGFQYWERRQCPPYDHGVGKGFQGRKCKTTGEQLPTKRAAIVINRALERIAVQQCGFSAKVY